MARKPSSLLIGHNGGPSLEPAHVPEWGKGGIGTYFAWKLASQDARKKLSPEIMLMRERRASALGLTYAEYALEILERGRFLQDGDAERIAQIKAARRNRRQR